MKRTYIYISAVGFKYDKCGTSIVLSDESALELYKALGNLLGIKGHLRSVK
jgi:hypothetical protein